MCKENNENNQKYRYTFTAFMTDFICLCLFICILECCGCHVCRGIGHAAGECVNAYRQTVNQTHVNAE